MRFPSILTILLVLTVATETHGRPYSPHSGKWMWDNSDVVCAVRMTKWTVQESAPGEKVLVIEYSDLQSFKGAERLPKGGALVLRVPELMDGIRIGFSREFSDNEVTLLFLENESGVLGAAGDDQMQFSASFEYKDPLSHFHSLKDLLLFAANRPRNRSISFLEFFSGFQDQDLRSCLSALSRSSDSETAYSALTILFQDDDPNAAKLAIAAIQREKDKLSPEMIRYLEDKIQNTTNPTQSPL